MNLNDAMADLRSALGLSGDTEPSVRPPRQEATPPRPTAYESAARSPFADALGVPRPRVVAAQAVAARPASSVRETRALAQPSRLRAEFVQRAARVRAQAPAAPRPRAQPPKDAGYATPQVRAAARRAFDAAARYGRDAVIRYAAENPKVADLAGSPYVAAALAAAPAAAQGDYRDAAAAAGAAAGAAIGSVFGPVGTAVGGYVGAYAGGAVYDELDRLYTDIAQGDVGEVAVDLLVAPGRAAYEGTKDIVEDVGEWTGLW